MEDYDLYSQTNYDEQFDLELYMRRARREAIYFKLSIESFALRGLNDFISSLETEMINMIYGYPAVGL